MPKRIVVYPYERSLGFLVVREEYHQPEHEWKIARQVSFVSLEGLPDTVQNLLAE